MSFYGSSFIFDDTQSELYDLRIFSELDSSGVTDSPAGGDGSIYEEWLYRRETPYFYGRYYTSSLEFDFVVGSFSYIDGNTRAAIEKWLLGRSSYLPLRIVQDDISDVVFNVIITRSTHRYIGNLNYALVLHAKCDRPWGIYNPPVLTKTYADGLMSETFDYVNTSMYDGYNRPVVTFVMGSELAETNYFSIVNNSDISGSTTREFRFDGLTPLEEITVDNDKGIITSSLGSTTLRMDKFNKNFFRLIPGVNSLTLTGYITEFTLSTSFGRGIGA